MALAPHIKIGNYHFNDFINLYSGKMRIVNWSWQAASPVWKQEYVPSPYGPSAANSGYEQPITDVFTIGYFGCDEEIREALVRLKRMVSKIVQYHGETEFPYWLWVQTKGEPGRRALLYNAIWKPESRRGVWPMLGNGKVLGQLSLTRHPLWENSEEYETVNTYFDISSCGGVLRFSDVPGTAPARIQRAELNAHANVGSTTNTLTDVWVGFRREGDGTTDFVPVWECEYGMNVVGADSTDEAETGPPYDSAGNHVQTTFSTTATLSERFYITVDDVITGTEYGHFAGEYLVLLRAYVDDDTAPAEVQMRYGYRKTASPETAGMTIYDSVEVGSESPMLYELGEIRIPPTQLWYDPSGESTYEKQVFYACISIWASGTDAKPLNCDCLILIPTSFFLRLRDAAIYYDAGPPVVAHKAVIVTEPDERVFGVNTHTSDYVRGICTPETKRWYMPEGNSIMVVAAQAATEQALNDLFWMDMFYTTRWEDYAIDETPSVAP